MPQCHADTICDVVGKNCEGHTQKCRDIFCDIGIINVFHCTQHMIPIKISTGPVAADGITRASGARNREIPKKNTGKDDRKSLSYTCFHTRRGFQIGSHARHTEQCSKTCGNSVHLKHLSIPGRLPSLSRYPAFAPNTENRTKSREEIRYKQGDQERNISKIQRSKKINIHKLFANTSRKRKDLLRSMCHTERNSHNRSQHNRQNHTTRNIPVP